MNRFGERRIILENGDVLIHTTDNLYFIAAQEKDGLGPWQMTDEDTGKELTEQSLCGHNTN